MSDSDTYEGEPVRASQGVPKTQEKKSSNEEILEVTDTSATSPAKQRSPDPAAEQAPTSAAHSVAPKPKKKGMHIFFIFADPVTYAARVPLLLFVLMSGEKHLYVNPDTVNFDDYIEYVAEIHHKQLTMDNVAGFAVSGQTQTMTQQQKEHVRRSFDRAPPSEKERIDILTYPEAGKVISGGQHAYEVTGDIALQHKQSGVPIPCNVFRQSRLKASIPLNNREMLASKRNTRQGGTAPHTLRQMMELVLRDQKGFLDIENSQMVAMKLSKSGYTGDTSLGVCVL